MYHGKSKCDLKGEKMNFTEVRTQLLKNGYIKEYEDLIQYMKNPYSMLSLDTEKVLTALGFSKISFLIRDLFDHSREEYRNRIAMGQVILWENYLNAYKEIEKTKQIIINMDVVVYSSNYKKATDQIIHILREYANGKAAITKLENELGVDRYLDHVSEEEFEFLIANFNEIHRIVEDKLKIYKVLFTENWNTTNIYNILIHRMIRSNMDNQVCTMFSTGKEKVLLFVIDGFGMGQYLWSQRAVPINKNYSYNENIFEWLSKNQLSDEYVLGAPFVTDTAAGISQIFIGKTSKDTRIFSSTVKKEGNPSVIGVKSEFQNDFLKIADTNYNSFTVDIASNFEEMKIYYCSKYDSDHASGFSKYVFDSADIKSIIPSERVFSFLKEDMNNKKSGVTVTYITNIDNSGHVMGSFSQFERYEHEKINMLLKNFLVDLAKSNPNSFDGKTSVLLTADHGMTESYKINISRKNIMDVIHSVHEHAGKIIEANRALFIYDVTDGGIEKCKEALSIYFRQRGIDALVQARGDELFDEFMPNKEDMFVDTTPDIAISLISEGIFYSKDVGENLMHFGGHGGHSIDEVFVPAINIELSKELLHAIRDRFLKNDLEG